MRRTLFLLIIMLTGLVTKAQRFSVSLGAYSGITASYTADKGIQKDPRYEGRFEAKLSPIGVNMSLDYEGFGLMISPGIINIGQNFYVVNTQGGQDGLRKNNLQYLTVPVAFKVHLVRFVAFKLSAVASLSPSFLLDGKEELSHSATKLQFPQEAHGILPSDYIVEYDGVLAPDVRNFVIAEKKDFRSLQVFAGAGLRSEWDPSNHWRISVDFRVNYGIFDPRTPGYTKSSESTLRLYDTPGERRDMFAQFTVGICRYIEFDINEKEQKKRLKGTVRKYKPAQYPGQKTRSSKPKE